MLFSPESLALHDGKEVYRIGKRTYEAPREFSGKFEGGKITVVFGPSGAGKTTLLRALSTLLPPASGTIKYNNIDVYSLGSGIGEVRRSIGISFQEPIFVNGLTLWGNIELTLSASGKLNGENKQRALKLAERLGVKNLLPKRPKEVSGGEARRVSLVRALAHNPSLITLDEPTAYLDWEATERIIGLLQERREEGKTVVVSTHDPELIKVGDVLYSLRYGRLVGD